MDASVLLKFLSCLNGGWKCDRILIPTRPQGQIRDSRCVPPFLASGRLSGVVAEANMMPASCILNITAVISHKCNGDVVSAVV
jgi:hypothetical protein